MSTSCAPTLSAFSFFQRIFKQIRSIFLSVSACGMICVNPNAVCRRGHLNRNRRNHIIIHMRLVNRHRQITEPNFAENFRRSSKLTVDFLSDFNPPPHVRWTTSDIQRNPTRVDPAGADVSCVVISYKSTHTIIIKRTATQGHDSPPCGAISTRPSHEGRLTQMGIAQMQDTFQSTPLTRGETVLSVAPLSKTLISIHSPHARGDRVGVLLDAAGIISIRSPHARGDPALATPLDAYSIFQSAPLSRGETTEHRKQALQAVISIRSPLTRGDQRRAISSLVRLSFQSTPLMRGETQHDILFQRHRAISIHSPHNEGRPP